MRLWQRRRVTYKLLLVSLLATVMVAGCKKSEEGGVPGTATFRISVPAVPASVSQGEMQLVRVSADRDTGFNMGVKLEIKSPKGLNVDPTSTTINPQDKGDVQLKITAANDAPLGDQKIVIKGTPDRGEPTETEFTITVKAK